MSSPRVPARRRTEVSALGYAVLGYSAVVVASLGRFAPGAVLDHRRPVNLAAILVVIVVSTAVLVVGRVTPRSAHLLSVLSIGAGVLLVWSLADPLLRTICSAWLLTVPMLLSPRLSARGIVLHGSLAAAAAALLVVGLPGDPGMVGVRTLALVGLILLPTALFALVHRDLHQAVRLAQSLAETDPVTGLLNRRGLESRFDAFAAQAARGDREVAVLLCDLDDFKRLNDTHGHAAGDDALRRAAATMSAVARTEDLVARLGGEEFVLVSAVREPDVAGRLAERLRAGVQVDCSAWDLTVSIGVAVGEADLAAGLEVSDRRLYRAKHDGRNRVRVAS